MKVCGLTDGSVRVKTKAAANLSQFINTKGGPQSRGGGEKAENFAKLSEVSKHQEWRGVAEPKSTNNYSGGLRRVAYHT